MSYKIAINGYGRIGRCVLRAFYESTNYADLRIVAHGAGRSNAYVANCTLDGQVLDAPFVQHADLVAGKTLEFWMAPQPTTFWVEA